MCSRCFEHQGDQIMLYLAVDHHKAHLLVRVLDDTGNCIRQRRVWTRPPHVDRFLGWLASESADQGGFIAMLEECGFTLWLERKLQEYVCRKVVKIQPLRKQPQKTDRRDATAIGELLWANRERILSGERLLQVRQVESPSEQDRCARVVIAERQFLKKSRNKLIYRIKDVLRRFNLEHGCPTKGLFTKAGRGWLEHVELPPVERRMIDRALVNMDLHEQQLLEVEAEIVQQAEVHAGAQVIHTIPGAAALTSLAIASRIGSIDRFPRPASLANFFGLAPGINDTGESVGRLGSITKRGNSTARFLLGQLVYHVMRKDPELRRWYRTIRKRRGRKTALVAAMRRITCIIWHMFKTGETYASVRGLVT